jgi:hypothetical protein
VCPGYRTKGVSDAEQNKPEGECNSNDARTWAVFICSDKGSDSENGCSHGEEDE